jgi:hypothetical protein
LSKIPQIFAGTIEDCGIEGIQLSIANEMNVECKMRSGSRGKKDELLMCGVNDLALPLDLAQE